MEDDDDDDVMIISKQIYSYHHGNINLQQLDCLSDNKHYIFVFQELSLPGQVIPASAHRQLSNPIQLYRDTVTDKAVSAYLNCYCLKESQSRVIYMANHSQHIIHLSVEQCSIRHVLWPILPISLE